MIAQASPALQSKLTGRETNEAPAFNGAAVKIDVQTLERWKAAYRHIDEWPAALQAIDDYCAANPADNAKQISRASSWLERRNHENRNNSEEAARLQRWSF
jgi:hypothetical protein